MTPQQKTKKIKIKYAKLYDSFLKTSIFTLLGEYIKADQKAFHRCNKCLHEWMVKPMLLKRGGGCPNCQRIQQTKSHDDFIEELKNTTWELMEGKYIGAHNEMLFKCKKCNQSTKRSAHKSLSFGCLYCKNSNMVFDTYYNKPTWLYYVKIPSKNLYKIGISKGGTEKRFRHEKFGVEIIHETLFENGFEAFEKEQEIIRKNKQYAWRPLPQEKFGGWSECFIKDIRKETNAI